MYKEVGTMYRKSEKTHLIMRIDSETKQEFKDCLEERGMEMSEVLREFINGYIKETKNK